jgi:hypothetical protein
MPGNQSNGIIDQDHHRRRVLCSNAGASRIFDDGSGHLTGESNHGPDGRSDDLKNGQQFDVQTDQSTSLLALSAF